MKSPLLLMVAMIGTCHRDHQCYTKTDGLRDLKTIRARYKHEGMGFLSKTLPSLDVAILRGIETGTFTCPSSFAKARDGVLPKFLQGLLGMMFDSKSGKLLEFEGLLLKNVRQLVLMFKKVQLDPKDFQSLSVKAEDGFIKMDCETDGSFERITYRHLDIFDRVTQLITDDFEYDRQEFVGKHGPGAVCENLSPNGKWAHLSDSVLVQDHPVFDSITELLISNGVHVDVLTDSRSIKSRLCSVPKNSTSVRLITIEPCVKQFTQGGLNLLLRQFIKRSPLVSKCLRLTDQARSRELARIGSLTRRYSTIDLSSASDTIDSTLVHRFWRHHRTFVEDLMMLARTPIIDVRGKDIMMAKHAGMGNATTFPIMSLTFAALVFAAMCDYDGKQPTFGRLKRYASCFNVYGDDIAIPSKYHSTVLDWLSTFGFLPNVGKSFVKSHFRESCGLDAYKGEDVTPIYVRVWPEDLKKTDAHSLSSLVASTNLLWLDGNHQVSDVIKRWVESVTGPLPLVTRDERIDDGRSKVRASGALGWHTRQNCRSISRWNRILHRFEYKGLSVKPVKIPDPISGLPALLKFFHLPYSGDDSLEDVRPHDHLSSSSKRYNTKVARGWFPA